MSSNHSFSFPFSLGSGPSDLYNGYFFNDDPRPPHGPFFPGRSLNFDFSYVPIGNLKISAKAYPALQKLVLAMTQHAYNLYRNLPSLNFKAKEISKEAWQMKESASWVERTVAFLRLTPDDPGYRRRSTLSRVFIMLTSQTPFSEDFIIQQINLIEDVNVLNAHGGSLLQYALSKNYWRVVQCLLNHPSFDVNHQNAEGFTPLYLALVKGSISGYESLNEIIMSLIEKTDLSIPSNKGSTVLHFVASIKDHPYTKQIVDRATQEMSVQRLENGLSALHLAALTEHEVFIEAYAARGFDLSPMDQHDHTPLSYCVAGKKEAGLQALIRAGVSIDQLNTNSGVSLLHEAIILEDVEKVTYLLLHGADPTVKTNLNQSAIDLAISINNMDLFCLLHDYWIHQDESGVSAIHQVAKWGRSEMLLKLMEAAIDVNTRTLLGATPLHYVVEESIGIIPTLIKSGADKEAKDVFGHTPLLFAASLGQTGVIEALIQSGANVHAQTIAGATAIELAITYGYLDTAKFLLEQNVEGWTEDLRNSLLLFASVIEDEDLKAEMIEFFTNYNPSAE